ncbi:MAG: ammonium transporter [Arenicellales bacterium]|jgi:Amt family ammonium transporter|nr:ammonium transporter [Arenicellales bacterium]MDP7221351.1 ammonium transporter [Arenicellales bacterium]|tara:strand:+ start:293 stop:2158 length:1866 start_codon:yes stop_codon:yes gene_type:complete
MEQIDMVWVLFCSCLVLFMQAGFSCLEAGLIRAKNTINVVIKNTVDFAISVVGFGLIGFSVMFGPSILGWLGEPFSLLNIASPHIYLVFVFQAMFCATATTILSGAVAERMSFYGYCFVAIFMVLMVYPVVGHWAWGGLLSSSENSGWLTKLGFRDFAGSTVVHSVGGWVALAAVLKLGPRIGRFGPGSSPIEPSSLTLTSLGVFLLWIGWLGFNGGSTLQASETVPLIVANTIVGGVFGIVASLILTRIRYGKPKALDILNGSLGGLVAVTAGCDAVMPWQAAIIGFIGGIVVAYVGLLLEKMRIDDAVGAIPVHLGAGVWGTLAVAVFVAPPEGTSQLGFLGIQALGVGSAAIYVFPLSMLFFYLSGKLVRYRVSEQAEIVGLNIIEHDARTATLDLIRQMSYQATSGEFKQQVVVDAQTEAHHIATFYNAVLDRVNFEEREKDAALEQATWLAQHDPLTGCLNRRTWFEAFGQAITELNDGSSCGLAMLDIDLFKRVNDTYGHTSGDAAIQHVVQKISDQIGDEASLGRFGGEEFVVFLVLTEKAIAEGKPGIEALMEQVRGALEGSPLEAEEGLIHLTISIGATEYRSGETPGDALQRADDALYAAKAGGRNQVRMA